MHWDGSVSVGNILTFLGMVAFFLGAAHRFAAQQKEQHHTMTAALNNLSAITDNLQRAVATQNGRLVNVETRIKVEDEVARRLLALGHPPA